MHNTLLQLLRSNCSRTHTLTPPQQLASPLQSSPAACSPNSPYTTALVPAMPAVMCCAMLCLPTPHQVASGLPPAQLSSTLVPIVRCAATNQVSMSFLTTGERHTLLLQLMGAQDASVAVLAAEAWCRCAVLRAVMCPVTNLRQAVAQQCCLGHHQPALHRELWGTTNLPWTGDSGAQPTCLAQGTTSWRPAC